MEKTAIKIEHVSKEYRLGAIGGGTLRGDLQSWMAKIRGKEDPNLKLDQAGGVYGSRFLALDDVSFEVKQGEAVGIIGHNGAGKSTLLKLLSRVTAPTKGTISYNGRIASMLEVGTGFHPELTGRENVYMNGAILGMTKAEIDKKFDEIVAFAEMEKFIDTPVKRYSSGMYVKLAFAVAAHLDSEIMIMDEVLAVGDMKFQQKCLGKMGDAANNEGRTVLYVSHNMNTIRQLCKRCIVMDHGRVIFDGDTEAAIALYMGNQRDPQVDNDLSVFDRSKFSTDKKIFMKQVTLRNMDSALYAPDQDIEMEITYDAQQDMDALCLRIPVFYRDQSVIGMATTLPNIQCRAGENRLTAQLKLPNLAPGVYYLRLVMYSVNAFGTTQTHDVVDEAVRFEIDDPGDLSNRISWEHKYWGSMRFPMIETKQ